MGSKIFRTIIERKIDNFINTYGDDGNSLFKNAKGKLIHPGEYGMYREECLKELLRFILNKDMSISDGFVITADEQISTQCDIIIYNSNVNAVIDNNIAKFFPMEIVDGIGEVKSDLDKADFKKAIRKLAENKMLFKERGTREYDGKRTRAEYNYPVSFLVCKKLKFNLDSLSNDIEDAYQGIPREYWHNAILSLEDGYLIYNFEFKKIQSEVLEIYKGIGLNTEVYKEINVEYPIWSDGVAINQTDIKFIKSNTEDIYYHVISFLTVLEKILKNCNKFDFDFVTYLDLGYENMFVK
ncbi:DUF6602 domain-containing protein [Clostridium beijerinckii]|uniref:DUF6602 domain-containing protein n=1 Tax=Clostridium beijerinckii TaxID=1520 RepID=A0A7X9SMJ6_CLOBE|nr:DUF6602 domain-containing protein [Clostridium beijerinckii]NMF04363.1 hypothetical protein [Clostridium beijerinckii]